MQESKFDKGFTKLPNILLNNLFSRQFTGVEMKLVLVIWRYSYGFMKESAELSNGFLAREIGSSTSVVSRLITRLTQANVLRVSYINNETKVRALAVNNNIGEWGIDKKSTHDPEVNRDIDCTVNGGIDQQVKKVLTVRSTYIENNKDIYKKIKKRVSLSEELEKIFLKWLDYKNERGDIYGMIPLRAVYETIWEKAQKWGDEAVGDVIMDCIASGYKNIVWEKLKKSSYTQPQRLNDDFISDYDHSALERMSRGGYNE